MNTARINKKAHFATNFLHAYLYKGVFTLLYRLTLTRFICGVFFIIFATQNTNNTLLGAALLNR